MFEGRTNHPAFYHGVRLCPLGKRKESAMRGRRPRHLAPALRASDPAPRTAWYGPMTRRPAMLVLTPQAVGGVPAAPQKKREGGRPPPKSQGGGGRPPASEAAPRRNPTIYYAACEEVR